MNAGGRMKDEIGEGVGRGVEGEAPAEPKV